jgi:hypothetical protein
LRYSLRKPLRELLLDFDKQVYVTPPTPFMKVTML